MMISGFGLSLLGLLDLGKRDIDVMSKDELDGTNLMFTLLSSRWPLGIIVMVYATCWIGGGVVLEIVHRCRGRVFEGGV